MRPPSRGVDKPITFTWIGHEAHPFPGDTALHNRPPEERFLSIAN